MANIFSNTQTNTFGTLSASFQSGIPIWSGVPELYISGGKIKNSLIVGDFIPGGSPCSIDTSTHEVKVLRIFKIKATSAATDTTISVWQGNGLPVLRDGMVLMVLPSTLAGTGKAYVVTGVDATTDPTVATFHVPTASIDAVAVDTYLVESASLTTQAAQAIYCAPTALTYSDVLMRTGDTLATVGVAYEGYVMANRIGWLPTIVKANITPQIVFDNI